MSIEEETGTPKFRSQEQKKLQESDSVRKQRNKKTGGCGVAGGRMKGRKDGKKKKRKFQ